MVVNKNIKAQMQISFGMIFSIILIIIFLAFASYAIITFLDFGSSAQAGKFINDLQADVDRIWGGSSEASEQREYFAPKKISSVCFVDFNFQATNPVLYNELKKADEYMNKNLIFYPVGKLDIESARINNIALDRITGNENPYCIPVSNGRIKLTLSKNYNEALVSISRQS